MSERAADATWATPDYSIAAYIHSRSAEAGIVLVNAHSQHRNGRLEWRFIFRDPLDRCPELAFDFINSGVLRYDQSVRGLKKIIFGWPGGTGGGRSGWATKDFSLAAYVLSHGVHLVGFRRIHSTRREYEFFFSDVHGKCPELEVRFVHSAAYRFDQSQRVLKKLCASRG